MWTSSAVMTNCPSPDAAGEPVSQGSKSEQVQTGGSVVLMGKFKCLLFSFERMEMVGGGRGSGAGSEDVREKKEGLEEEEGTDL